MPGALNITSKLLIGKSSDGVSSTITDSLYDGNSLCIVGQGTGPNRKITMWDNVQINGINTVRALYTAGGTNNNPGGKDSPWGTHFPYLGDGNNYIRGDTIVDGNIIHPGVITSNRVNNKENNAQFIRIGNKIDATLRKDYLTIIEVRVYSHSGENIALNKPVSIIEGKRWSGALNNDGLHGNITNGIIFPTNTHSDNWMHGFIGDIGINVLQIDLGAEYNISQIEIFNRWNDLFDWRLDGTTIELIGANKNVNKIIYTGLWHRQYSKTFLL
jgi:hypothetical protein